MTSDHVGLLAGALVLALVGWGGLAVLVQQHYPRIGGELWLFFVLLMIAVCGTVIPFVRYLNVRFTPLDAELPPVGVMVRQAVWVGLFVVTNAWLLIPRLLNVPLVLFIGGLFVVVELFLRSRERRETE
jgi:hypothetical protein